MINYYKPVVAKMTVAGTNYDPVSLNIFQKFNDHHTLVAVFNYEQLETAWMDNPEDMFSLIGRETTVEFSYTDGSYPNYFIAVVTNVEYTGENGEQNNIVITGKSLSILLDGKKNLFSFAAVALENIVKRIGSEIPGALPSESYGLNFLKINPAYKEKLAYICQYNETGFEFLNRLSWMYGEWLYYDGVWLHFGQPEAGPDEGDPVVYDVEMTQLGFSANLYPATSRGFAYLVHEDKEIMKPAPEKVEGAELYHDLLLNRSAELFPLQQMQLPEALVDRNNDLEYLLEIEKARAAGHMVVLSGTTRSSKIRIGRAVDFCLPTSMRTSRKEIGRFRIIEVEHFFDEAGHYENRFKAVPADLKVIPMQEVQIPKAFPQTAIVTDNEDEEGKGRVKVHFQWQPANYTTPWIRVQTPDAGSSDAVGANRGMVFIPEVGDRVMVDFEYGDPSRPYVAGSIFPETESKGGDEQNAKKCLTTRAGSYLLYNDERNKGSVTLKDGNGSNSTIDMDGAGNIRISAGNSLTITIGDSAVILKMDAGGNLKIDTKQSAELYVEENALKMDTQQAEIESPESITFKTKDWAVNAKGRSQLQSDGDIQIKGSTVDIN